MDDDSITHILDALQRSSFRRRFSLKQVERAYLKQKGWGIILLHAASFVKERLAPIQPKQDGKQTPYQGHPVFVAQHATATCCRTCLQKWHHFPKQKLLTPQEQQYVVDVIEAWLKRQITNESGLQQSLI